MLLQNMAFCIFAGGRPLELIGYSHGDTGGSNTTLTINKPAGVVSGDLLIAIMGMGNTNTTWTGDTGWAEKIDQAAQPNLRIATLVAGGAEPSSYTFTQSNIRNASGIILHLRGAAWDTSGAIGVGEPIAASGITCAGGILFAAYVSRESGATFSTPSGMDDVASFSAEKTSYHIFSQDAEGATGSRSSTQTGGNSNDAGVLFGVKSG